MINTDEEIAGRITGVRQQLAEVAAYLRDREPMAADALIAVADDLGWVAWLARPTREPPTSSVLLHRQHPAAQ